MTNNSNFHMAAFTLSPAGAVTNTAMSGVADQMLTLSTSTTFLTPDETKVVGAFGTGPTMTRLRLNTPSLREIGLPSMVPINASATVPSPYNIYNSVDNPIPIPTVDPFGLDLTDTAADVTEALLVLQYRYQPIPAGQRYRLRATATITGVLNSWASGGITMDTVLPAGRYAVIGMDVVAANVIAARLIFADGGPRPGCVVRNSDSAILHPFFTDGRLGKWGEFQNANVPNLEILLGNNGANASQEIFLDLVQVSKSAYGMKA